MRNDFHIISHLSIQAYYAVWYDSEDTCSELSKEGYLLGLTGWEDALSVMVLNADLKACRAYFGSRILQWLKTFVISTKYFYTSVTKCQAL